MDAQPLSGIRVLDFTWVLAGPYATRILADFGAEVIKVQSKRTAQGTESNLTGYFNSWNRNKRSITLDMSHPEAIGLLLALASKSDVLIENFSPRVMRNWGLNYGRLREIKADLIMISMSAMGQTGPSKDYVAFAPTLHALSGITSLTSVEKDVPIGPGYAYADSISGLYAALAILASLEYREKSGEGQYIDLSEYEALCTLMGPALLDASVNDKEPLPLGNQSNHITAAPYGCYECSGIDRWCVMAACNEEEWQNLCKVLGDPRWTKEERFSSEEKRKENREELDQLLTLWTSKHSPEEVVGLLQNAGVPAGIVQNAEDLANDPQLAEREFFVRLKHPVLGSTCSERSPIILKESSNPNWKAAPSLGEDNRYVFLELLGLAESEFNSYIENGVIG